MNADEDGGIRVRATSVVAPIGGHGGRWSRRSFDEFTRLSALGLMIGSTLGDLFNGRWSVCRCGQRIPRLSGRWQSESTGEADWAGGVA